MEGMSERHNLPHFPYEELDVITAIQIYRRAYTAMAEPSLNGAVPDESDESYVTDEAGIFETTYIGTELLGAYPEECATLGIVEDDEITFTIQVSPDDEPCHIPTFFLFRYPQGDIEDMRIAWVINGPEGHFRTRITGDAIESDDLGDVPLMQEELDAINTLTGSMFPEAPEFA